MKILKFLLSLLATVALVWVLANPFSMPAPSSEDKAVKANLKKTTLPPLGDFFNPFAGFWQCAESVDEFLPLKIELPELKGKVKIAFDERLVPHIFAENSEEASFAQGYVTAKYRLWQMDLLSRAPAGRLAEVLGEDLLDVDKRMRRGGMLFGAENAVRAWQKSPENFRLIQAYADGVNAYMKTLTPVNYPLEFKLLNYYPEPWSPLKTALVKKYMDMTLCLGEDDIEATNALQVLGKDLFAKLYPEYNPKQTPVIPAGTKWNFTPAAVQVKQELQEAIGLIEHKVYPKERELVGSNNWAVAGWKTKSGKPILCNDPHLRLTLPSIWFENQIVTPKANGYGVSVPGIPGILIGFNENIAWGETNVGQDVLDWYKITWTDAAKTSYQLDGTVKKARIVVEKYKVKGLPEPVLDTVRWTEWGPVVYESSKDSVHKHWNDLAMHWLAHDEPNPNDIGTFVGLMQGKNYDDYSVALEFYDFPAQNFVFASKTGDIAIKANGKYPLKRKQQGRFVLDGSNSQNGWQGFIPHSHVPQIKNPARGFVASANQHSTDPTYPYYYNANDFDDFRARYLVRSLSEMDSITPEDMMALQNSNFSIHAAEALPALLAQIDTSALTTVQSQLLKKLRKWDYRFEKGEIAPAVFEVWWKQFYEQTFDEVLVWEDSLPILKPESWRLIELLTTAPADAIFDNIRSLEKETARQIATASFVSTTDSLATQLLDPTFNWANHKKTSIYHMLRIPAFSRTNLDVGGYRQALNAISEEHGPSWRMIVELGDEVKAWGVFPGGQSGNPGSPYYDTGIEKWMKGEYNELVFMKDVEDKRKAVLFTIEMN